MGTSSHAQGRCNIADESYAHVVGNGTSPEDQDRSNAHTLDWGGNAWYAGDVYVGSNSGKNHDEGSKKLATEEYAEGLVNDLSAYVGTLPTGTTATSVVDYVNIKTAGVATDAALEELNNQLGGLQDAVDAIEADYLKAADKTELQDQITTNANAIELLTNGVSADEVDSVNDLIKYVKEHGTEVTGMKEDIAENAAAIAKEIGDRESAIEGLQGQIDALGITDGKVANAAAADKAADADKLGGVVAADYALKTDVETAKSEAIVAAAINSANKDAVVLAEAHLYTDNSITELSSNTTSQIETAKSEAVAAAATATGEAIAAHNTDENAHADIRTSISDLAIAIDDAFIGLIAQFETKLAENLTAASEESSEKDAVVLAEAQNTVAAHAEDTDLHVTADKQAAWDAAKATADTAIQSVTAAADSGLKATQTGTSVAIEIDESITWIFDCGGASI
jgi:hypothetical protein